VIRDLEGKLAVVTGAANGIGRALAIGFAAEGMRVVAAGVDEAGAKRVPGS
jgi:NAD(P)-dependent dehydrogenase (short-subunit alcohol dehydrogenase family)